MKLILLFLFCLSVGVGQTKTDSTHNAINRQRLEEMMRLKESVRIKADRMNFTAPNKVQRYVWVDTAGNFHFETAFWLAFVVKWREYEAECRKDSVLHQWWGPNIQDGVAYGNFHHSEWIPRKQPTFSGFILWLERKK